VNFRLSSARSIVLRSLPLAIAAIGASVAPAFAAVGGGAGALAGIQAGATNVQAAMLGVGFAGAVIGVAFAGWHFLNHRDDWAGSAGRLLGGIIGGVIVSQAVPLASLGGGALF
jgi:hypothetical protein